MDKHQAGHELDTFVAERIMGWKDKGLYWLRGGEKYLDKPELGKKFTPPFSTDISAAWEVVEKIQDYQKPPQAGHPLRLEYHWWVNKWWACIGSSEDLVEAVPLAICRAALKAVKEL